MMGRVSVPGTLTAMPSAMLWPLPPGVSPRKALYMDGYRAASTPTISIPGLSALAAVAMPAIKPPPPTGTTMTSRSGWSANISSAMVPWPAMIFSSS